MNHGVYIQERASSLVITAAVDAGLPVVIGTAPGGSNEPAFCASYDDALKAIGGLVGVNAAGRFEWTLCEFVKSFFVNYGLGSAVLINVFDKTKHITGDPQTASATLKDGAGVVDVKDAIIEGLTIDSTPVPAEDYTIAFNSAGKPEITRAAGATVLAADSVVSATYKLADPSAVTAEDVLAGIEKVAEVYPRFLKVPGQILAPGFSSFPSIATAMASKAALINGSYKAVALIDLPTGAASIKSGEATEAVTAVATYQDAPAAKTAGGYAQKNQIVAWPMGKLGTEIYHGSTVLAGSICMTDGANDGIPYASPSNRAAKINGSCLADGTAVWLDQVSGNVLNGAGIVTFLNKPSGWLVWGSQTGAYPGSTAPEETFIPVRRMFDWVGNTLVNTYFQKIDLPLNKRQIETILDSAGVWLNGLKGGGYLVGGRVEFNEASNPPAQLAMGKANFEIYLTPPSPNQEILFTLEYDANAYAAVFGE